MHRCVNKALIFSNFQSKPGNVMINRHEMSPRSNSSTNINFCHREPLTQADLPA